MSSARAPSSAPGERTTSDVGKTQERSVDVHVMGSRPRASARSPLPPQRSFSPVDLRSYGADNVGDLLQAIASQTGSIRGREAAGPVVLLNGRRISSFAEIARVPTEAIERVDILPEEVALSYGFRADQKVVNIILFQRFQSRIAQGGATTPKEGGRETVDLAANLFRLSGDTRILLDASLQRADQLVGVQRGLSGTDVDANLGTRTLLPGTSQGSASAVVAGRLAKGLNGTVNLGFTANDADSLVGIDPTGPTPRRSVNRSFHAGTTVAGFFGTWPWTFTGNVDHASSGIRTAASSTTPIATADSANDSFDAGLLANGSLLRLPSGTAAATVRLGLGTRTLSSSFADTMSGHSTTSRRTGTLQTSIDVPLLKKAEGGGLLGGVSGNLNLRVDEVSGFGGLRTFGYGLSWSPNRTISFIASVTDEQGAPTVEQLGSPRVVTPGYPVFDFNLAQAVSVTRIFGGNPDLRHDDRHLLKLGATIRPLPDADMVLSVNFVSTRIRDLNRAGFAGGSNS